MPVTTLVELARDKSAKGRSALVKAISEIFFSNTKIPGDIEKRLFGDVVSMILDQVADEIRADIAERVARSDHVDRALVVRLANDDAVVAVPILKMSPLLVDADLVDIARARFQTHRLAIAARPGIGETVTDILTAVGEPEVLRAVASNRGARFSLRGLGQLLDRGGTDPAVQKSLSERSGDESGFAGTLKASLTAELRARLGTFAMLVHDGRFEAAAKRAALMIDEGMKRNARRQLERAALHDAIRDGRRTIDSVVGELCMEDRLGDCIWLLSHVLRIDEPTLKRSLLHCDTSSMVVLCRASAMGMRGFCALSRLICHRLGRSEHETADLARIFSRTRQRDARRTVLLIRETHRKFIATTPSSSQPPRKACPARAEAA